MSSGFWMLVIVMGALAVAVGNIQYPKAREVEQKKAWASQALSLLQPELQANLELLQRTKSLLGKTPPEVTLQRFNTTAWDTVSGSELLIGLGSGKLSRLMQTYHLVNQANHIHEWIEENSLGISSVVRGEARNKNKESLISGLSEALNKLEPLLKSLIEEKLLPS